MVFKEIDKTRLVEQIARLIARERDEDPDEIVTFQQPYMRKTGGISMAGCHFYPVWSLYSRPALRILQYIENREWDNVISKS